MSKTDYILRSLSKITKKRWEHYVINRIFHKLDDPEIEFVCQQCIRKSNSPGKIYLADLFFPQLELYLEIDEEHHDSDEAKKADAIRRLDIIETTGFIENRIPASNVTLEQLNASIDEFVNLLIDTKEKLKAQKNFLPWDYNAQYTAERHINAGFMEVGPHAIFRYHRDALECFGYINKGHHQSGSWKLPENIVKAIGLSGRTMVWFPRLYKAGVWDNELSRDGEWITEKSLEVNNNYIEDWDYRIVMAHSRDELNRVLYRFLGVFQIDKNQSVEGVNIFKRINTKVKVFNSYN
ncbi:MULTISPECIES: AbaSI family restriction endonuclease [Enterobacterales]|uniref:AbaSI family restriction endonuclease n=1 Tax=Enterobacterales TaxID=91347 RepID=UPI0008481496|nr:MULTISPECIES: hypothetical protein [Enterobacterales]ODQ07283.1 hypothetical protein BGK50_02265 [Shigella sp. FC130]OEI94676.1 hypothetical protein BHE86_02280 [Shigella sp. FC1655]WOO48524.1 hypothetical protein R2S03_13670 [Hafnia alvei]WPF02988.1 hypothetical protein SB028_12505 [Proteus vulgaris]